MITSFEHLCKGEGGRTTALVAAAAVINGHLNPGPSFDYTRIREGESVMAVQWLSEGAAVLLT